MLRRLWWSWLAAFSLLPTFARADDAPSTPGASDAPASPGAGDARSTSGAGDAPASPGAGDARSTSGASDARSTHRYTLAECLALAERNFAGLWAARARLALAHAQLDEAVWVPWFQWSAQSLFGVGTETYGTVLYPQSTQASVNVKNLNWPPPPFLMFSINGTLPLVTFGKIETAREAAEANVRVSEWDMEKQRQQMRLDVRRAYFGVGLARDAKYVVDEALGRIDDALRTVKERLARGDGHVTPADAFRLEAYRQEIYSTSLQAPKGESYGMAALRLLTGVEEGFDRVDTPLKRPESALGPIVQYLQAARILRPDVNMARAAVVARGKTVDYSRARLLPDLGLTFASTYSTVPGAPSQLNVWSGDSSNEFLYSAGLGVQWGLDLLPKAAREAEAESSLEESRSLERHAFGNAMLEVEKAYADAAEAKAREEASDRAEHETKEWLAIVMDQIDLGTADESALLEPLRAYGSARVRHLYALMDDDVALSQLALASGWDGAAPTD